MDELYALAAPAALLLTTPESKPINKKPICEIVEKAIRQSGISLTALAKKLGKSRRWMYQIFEQPQLSTDVILQIGNIIHYDFTEEIQSLSKYKIIDTAPFQAQEPPAQDYWKDKYLELLEQYKLLLINYNQLLETPASK